MEEKQTKNKRDNELSKIEELVKTIECLRGKIKELESRLDDSSDKRPADDMPPFVLGGSVDDAHVYGAALNRVPGMVLKMGDRMWLALPVGAEGSAQKADYVWFPFDSSDGVVHVDPAAEHCCQEYLESCGVRTVELPHFTKFFEHLAAEADAEDDEDTDEPRTGCCGPAKCNCRVINLGDKPLPKDLYEFIRQVSGLFE